MQWLQELLIYHNGQADTLSNGIELMAGGDGLNMCKHAEIMLFGAIKM